MAYLMAGQQSSRIARNSATSSGDADLLNKVGTRLSASWSGDELIRRSIPCLRCSTASGEREPAQPAYADARISDRRMSGYKR